MGEEERRRGGEEEKTRGRGEEAVGRFGKREVRRLTIDPDAHGISVGPQPT